MNSNELALRVPQCQTVRDEEPSLGLVDPNLPFCLGLFSCLCFLRRSFHVKQDTRAALDSRAAGSVCAEWLKIAINIIRC